jgi:hypothetical protein
MLHPCRERGLSEIVGFILILAAIVIAVALYSIYGIPAQGREGEISHMNDVRDRFVEFKVNLDSLLSNRQCGTAIGTSFTLGTGGGATTGSFSIIPILEPVKTPSTLALNQRAEYITISQDSYFMVNSGGFNDSGTIAVFPGTNLTFNMTPRYFFINLSSPDLLAHGVHICPYPIPAGCSAWDAWVNVTPVYTFSRNLTIINGTGPLYWNVIYNFYWTNESQWNRTDITVSTSVAGTPVMQGFIVNRNITVSPLTNYVVDLMNPSYGLSSALGSTLTPQTITAFRTDSALNASYITNYSYWPSQTSQSYTMGSLEYRSQNEYWICQTYYYQMGGVFLEQSDGNTVKIPPAITFNLASGIPVVNINEILLSGSQIVQGTGPVQVTSSIASITNPGLASGNNTRWVNITVDALSNNAALAWNWTLLNAANKAGFPSSLYSMNTAGSETTMNISSGSIYGIQLSLQKTLVNAAIQTASPSGT